MKKKLLPTVAVILSFLLTACSSPSGDNMDLAVGSPSIDYQTDWAVHGLLGPVKTVTLTVDGDEYVTSFTQSGKLINSPVERTQFKGRVRTDHTTYFTGINYTFDQLGRVISEDASDYSGTYEYEGDHYFPASTSFTYYEEGSEDADEDVRIYEYRAKDFDEHGNWLIRKANGTIQKRVIDYYPDPYDLGDIPRYKSAKDVIKAVLKAEKKSDVHAFLGTIEYRTRKNFGLTEEYMKDRFNPSVKAYRLTDVIEERTDGSCDVKVHVIRNDGDASDWWYSAYQDDDGFWYYGMVASKAGED